jgi:hypothetical protein
MTLKPQRDAETSPPSVSEGLGMTGFITVTMASVIIVIPNLFRDLREMLNQACPPKLEGEA